MPSADPAVGHARRSGAGGLSASEGLRLLLDGLAALPAGEAPRPFVLAVSGGPDSLALFAVAAENLASLRAAGFVPHVATVDHGLRPESALEAAWVGKLAEDAGLAHRVLRWTDRAPGGNLCAEARAARYRLLAGHAQSVGAAAVLTAHHQDDQIETHLLAAARGAGDRGLAGMRACRALSPGLLLLRPFLGIPGARLRASVAERGFDAVDDPSNRDPRFGRARLRRSPAPDPAARTACLERIAAHAAARDAEDAALGRWVRTLAETGALAIAETGSVRLAADAFRAAERRTAHLLLERILPAVGGAEHAPGHAAVARLCESLRSGPIADGTLGGVAIAGRQVLTFFREYGRFGPRSVESAGACAVSFDRRMRLFDHDGRRFPPASRVAAFGSLGRGNRLETVLPVLLGADAAPIAAHPALLQRLPGIQALGVLELVSFRILADLPPTGGG